MAITTSSVEEKNKAQSSTPKPVDIERFAEVFQHEEPKWLVMEEPSPRSEARMEKELAVLIVEDQESDAQMIVRLLRKAGFDLFYEQVDSGPAMRAALEKRPWDLVVSDYRMPQFDGRAALSLLKETGLDIPFIMVSGTIGEETAVEMMKAGAHDYLMKGKLARLVPAIERELAQRDARRERKNAEAQLRLESAALNAAANAIVITNREGSIEWANPSFAALTGYGSSEVVGKNLHELFRSDQHDPVFYEQLWGTILAGRIWNGEMISRRKDGTTYTEEQTITPVLDEHGEISHFIAIKQDISKRKLLEGQVRQMQKLEGLGTLAAGIAHDFNNILGIVLGNLALLERTRENEDQFIESTSSIEKAVERGASLVRQILTFARKTDTRLEPVNINAAIKELAKMLFETFPKTISITVQLEKTLPIISMDATQLHQTLLNLCVNARDAMDGRGELKMRTQLVTRASISDRFLNATATHYVKLSVTDSGSGMDEETKQKIFEPFFTTKEEGKGTGLGLAVVYGVVQAHNGFIDVESALNAGTTFNLFFPIPEGILALDRARPERSEDLPGGDETILVVEDEPILRELLVKFLENAGYTVIPAIDGDEAVALYRAHKDDIDLVISDLGLPKKNGWEAFVLMQQSNPKVRALLATGYLEPGQRSDILESGVRKILNKPYYVEEILNAVRETLDETDNQASS